MRGDLVAFLDSNVLVYAVSRNEPDKQRKAKALIDRGFAEGCFAISTQVLLARPVARGSFRKI
jgi:predicted nucleic acid-binding protein